MTVAILALLLTAAGAHPTPRKVAVLIGANAPVAERGALRFAHRDAEQLASTLVAVSGFAPDDVRVLEDPEPSAVLRALDALAQQSAVALFYFSGHADPQTLYTAGKPLPLAAVKERLESSPAALRIGIVDACHGGGWTRAKGLVPSPALEVPVVKLLSSEGSALLASSSGLEQAHESDALEGSFFTHHLIAALRGAAEQTPAGEVTLHAAYRYAEEHTVHDSALYAGEAQHPSFELNLHGRSDVVLAQVNDAGGQLLVEQHEGPLQLMHLATGARLLELAAGARRVRLAVEPGSYLLRREGEDGVYAKELTVEAGKTLDVDEASLTLVGQPLLAAKGPPEPRPFDATVYVFMPFAGAQLDNFYSLGLSVSFAWRFEPRWGLRARAGYEVARSLTSSAEALAVASVSTTKWIVDGSFGVDGLFVPVIARLGDWGRFEVQVAVGTGAVMSREYTVGPDLSRRAIYTAIKPQLSWAPISLSPSLRFYFNDRVAISAEVPEPLDPLRRARRRGDHEPGQHLPSRVHGGDVARSYRAPVA
jgi:hypothetical protein